MPVEKREAFWRDVNVERCRLIVMYFRDRPDVFSGRLRYPVGKLGFTTLAHLMDVRCTHWLGHTMKAHRKTKRELQDALDSIDKIKMKYRGVDE